jgi:5-formyltetrahydrofolate cyclo-ligase
VKENTLGERKRRARSKMKSALGAVSAEVRAEWSSRIASEVQKLPQWQSSPAILAFLSMPTEVDTTALLEAAFSEGKTVGVPRMNGSEINFHEITSLKGPFEPHPYGLREPVATLPVLDPLRIDSRDVFVVTPGLCFDGGSARLGFGRGYYDRLITLCRDLPEKNFYFAGVCFHIQLIDCVPTGDHDRTLDALITEHGVEYSSRR